MQSQGELEIRRLIMEKLAVSTAERGFVTREELIKFDFNGTELPLIDRSRGIRNPKSMEATLSVMSSPSGPYDDQAVGGGLFRYDYRDYRDGSIFGDNTKLRDAFKTGLPIIWFRKIATNVFVPVFPVYVVADDVENRQFMLALDENIKFLKDPLHPSEHERRYIARLTKQRLHQPEFRGRIMRAYETRCAVCHLKHGRLLDAAHIIGDSADGGEPVVENGLALCKIHHAAYDSDLLGISPNYVVKINSELLAEQDGPMLAYGIQAMHDQALDVPRRIAERPDRARLASRFETFLAAG